MATMHHSLSQIAFTLACLIGALASSLAAANNAAQEASLAEARITHCRIGFDNRYKVGYWTPVWVDVQQVGQAESARIEATTVDSDGINTTTSAAIDFGDESSTHVVYVKAGRLGARIRISLIVGDVEVDQRTLDPTMPSNEGPMLDGLPANSDLIVSIGAGENGLKSAFPDRDEGGGQFARRVVQIESIAALPNNWYGYESVDLIILSTHDAKLCRALAADERRSTALRRWVELGGRVLVLAGAQAIELFGDEGRLSGLLPGKLSEAVRTTEVTALELYADTSEPILGPAGRAELEVPKLVDTRGVIEAYVGPRPTALPLVVRAPLGLGETSFAGLTLEQPPLADWNGRSTLWRALVQPYINESEMATGSQQLGTLGYNDLSGALRQRMGRSFTDVTRVPFSVVALLAIIYMLLLGPLSYWLIHRFGGRSGLAWVVFPLLILATSTGAFWYGEQTKGSTPRINELELIDFDQTTGLVRGTYWATMYSPRSQRFDFRLNGRPFAIETTERTAGDVSRARSTLLSWWGLPGVGIGGMQSSGQSLRVGDVSYRMGVELNLLTGVPVLSSATKSLFARWVTPSTLAIDAQLVDDDGMLAGTLVNETGTTLVGARLLYGTWAYRLGDLTVGQQIEIGQHLDPIKIQTLVTQLARGTDSNSPTDRGRFLAERATVDELLALMMFYQAAGGQKFSDLPNQYQRFCDLSRLVTLGRAILVAEVEGVASQLVNDATSEPFADEIEGRRVTHRFVLPVEGSF